MNDQYGNEIPIGTLTSLKDLYPCIYFDAVGESVELIQPLNIGSSKVEFNLGSFQNKEFLITNNTIIMNFQHQNQLALIEEPWRHLSTYKFFINGPLDSFTGVGVCSKKITTSNNFGVPDKNPNKGGYIFHAGSHVSIHGHATSSTNYLKQELKFFEKNELSLSYDTHFKKFQLSNDSWMLTANFSLTFTNEELSDMHICVLLNGRGQEISVVRN